MIGTCAPAFLVAGVLCIVATVSLSVAKKPRAAPA